MCFSYGGHFVGLLKEQNELHRIRERETEGELWQGHGRAPQCQEAAASSKHIHLAVGTCHTIIGGQT